MTGRMKTMPKSKQICACTDCKTRIKMVEVTLGTCRCQKVFCPKHRLPEAHQCQLVQRISKDAFVDANKCIAPKIETI